MSAGVTDTVLQVFLNGTGWRTGLCSRFIRAADELTHTAKDLRSHLEKFEKAPDPFAALVSTVHNNQEFEKFLEHPVDTGTKPGV